MTSEDRAAPGRQGVSWRSGAARTVLRGTAGAVAFLLLAEVLGRTHVISPSVLPLTSTVLARTIGLAGNPQFLGDLAATLLSWAIGLALAVVVAVPLGVVLGSLPGVRAATRAIVEFLRPIPSVALILLVGLILGPGLRETVTLIVYAAIWPVLFNTIYGLDDADPVARETLRAFGFGRLSVIRFASLPGAAPFIATGIRLASSIAIILNISTGYLTGRVSGNGLGAYIAEVNTGSGNTDLVLAAAIWAGVLGLVLNGLLLAAQRRLLPWHRELTAEAA